MPTPPYYSPFDGELPKRNEDFQLKVIKIQELLHELSANAGVFTLAHNFAWLTSGGRSQIFHASEGGVGGIYIDHSKVILLTNNIEAERLQKEELDGIEIEVFSEPWYSAQSIIDVANQFANGGKVLIDSEGVLDNALATLRQKLTTLDIYRYRQLGKDCSSILTQVAKGIQPGQTEWEIGSLITQMSVSKGIDVVVLLVATDDRVDHIRHPLPTTKKLKQKAMLVLCGRRGGLIASLTRMVYCSSDGTIPDTLRQRHDAVTFVDASAYAATVPGVTSKSVFESIQQAYASRGFLDEWTFHHQGGGTGYKSREWKASPTSPEILDSHQAFAWNPSIGGTKSEDTILLHENGEIEILTQAQDGWPLLYHTIGTKTFARPDILLLKV